MNIVECLKKYDFSAEYAIDEYRDASAIEKYIIYKAYTLDSNWSDEFQDGKKFREEIRMHYLKERKNWIQDPDDNPQGLLWKIYKRIWPELECTYSDTMTSVQYIMSGYFEGKIETKEEKDKRLAISRRQPCSIRYMINLFAADGEEGQLTLKEKIGKAAARLDNKHEHLEDFLAAWHRLGNYCPVPKGFNGARSNMGKHDFWDLTLMMIRKWYLTDDSNKLLKECILKRNLFHNNSNADIKACVDWLNQCGGKEGSGEERWEKFVKTLCLEEWVSKEDTSYYEVLPLWKGHGWDNVLLPNNWEDFFMEYNRRIMARTMQLIERLSLTDES